ncbi:iron-sulfur cluster assembly scaffold protein [Novosphingobium umbonatum]|uniref:Iron-sulfur cluster assembly scaffold protein n=1 Tax=Novosphingobium umbonatum TaxID=1908524 RepID=A0A3S2VF22_9SPHN|nr:iron-sulfur cluster assembly scaffold protein [Novosphingobium umbonatum]
MLMLATSLVSYPLDEALPLQGHARSASCGSSLRVALALDASGAIDRIGVAAQACAIGQAATAIMLGAAKGLALEDFRRAETALQNWLSGEGDLPDWPGLHVLEPARAFAGRHGAILLGWQAVINAFSSADAA